MHRKNLEGEQTANMVDFLVPPLSRGEDTEITDRLFSAVVTSVIEVKPEGDAERAVYGRLLGIANLASAHRDERLAISAKRMPKTLLLFVTMTATMILFLLLFFPFQPGARHRLDGDRDPAAVLRTRSE